MYKIYYSLLILMAVTFLGCNPMEDVYDDLDKVKKPYKEDVIYTLVADDYASVSKAAKKNAKNAIDSALATAVGTELRFNDFATPSKYMYVVLSAAYPALNEESSAKVTYNYDAGTPAYLTELAAAPEYKLTNADYLSIWGEKGMSYLTPEKAPEKAIAGVLKDRMPDAQKGDICRVEYNFSAEKLDIQTELRTDFESGLVGWINYAEKGSRLWEEKSFSGNKYMQFSANNSDEENTAWLITPGIDLSSSESPMLTFDIVVGYWKHDGLQVLISTDFEEDPTQATWTDVTDAFYIPQGPTRGYSSFASAGQMSLASYKEKIYVAFKYTGSGIDNAKTTTFQIDNVFIGEGEVNNYQALFEAFEGVTVNSAAEVAGWLNYTEKGNRDWQGKSFGGNAYLQCSANDGAAECVSWMVTPQVNIPADAAYALSFDVKVGFYKGECLQILISTDFDGTDVNAATWTDVTSEFTLPTQPTSGYGDAFESAGKMVLDAYKGQAVYVAFKYTGEGPSAKTTTYQIDNVKIGNAVITRSAFMAAPAASESPVVTYAVYEFDGSEWAEKENTVILQPQDYVSMGAPGKNGNFSSSILPENYLPAYLKLLYPYAQENEQKAVLYKYYNGSTVYVANEYTYTGGVWTPYNNTAEMKDEQYVVKNGKWVFDPTINYTLVKEDYQIVVDWVEKNKPAYMDSRGNTEYWFGFTSYNRNINLSLSTRRNNDPEKTLDGKPDTEAQKIIDDRAIDGLILWLHEKYTTMTPQVNGIDVFANITYKVYDEGAKDDYVARFQCVGVGEFKLVEGPVRVEVK